MPKVPRVRRNVPLRRRKRNSAKASADPNRIVSVPTNTYRTTVQQALGFSRSQVVVLRYAQQVTLAPNTNAFASITFAANGPFAPYISSTTGVAYSATHQPKGWDQWTAIYNEYIVLSNKIHVTSSPPNSTNPTSAGGLLTIHLSDGASPYSTATSLLEDGKAKYRQFNPNTSSDSTRLSHQFVAKSFWRLKDIDDNQKGYGAFVSANPSELAYYHVGFFCNDTSVTTTSGPLLWVIMDYVILFTGPTDLTQS